MKIAVLGAGLMGESVARDLVRSGPVQEVGLADINLSKAKQVSVKLQSKKIKAFSIDAGNQVELAEFIQSYDVVINALFYTFNEIVARTAIAKKVHYVDLGGHIGHVTDKILGYKKAALASQVTLIPDLGVAPGMINILAGFGASKLDMVESIKMFVGGIPLKPEPPLEYNQVFSMEGVLDHYTDSSLIIRDGVKHVVPSLTGIEEIYFEKFGPLEAFHTAGGTSTLPYSYPFLDVLEYKTIRYPGHAKKFKLLVDLNLTRKDYEIDILGQKVKPRDILLKVLDPIVALKEKEDVVLLRVIVSGTKNGIKTTYEYETIVYKDRHHHVTAMAQVTANTISIVAQMIGEGIINKRGIYPPEQIVPGEKYVEEMEKRGIVITENIK